MRRSLIVLATIVFLALWPAAPAGGAQPGAGTPQPGPEDFNGDSFPDLAIGTPGENEFSGVVHVLYGGPPGGLGGAGSQLWSQDSPGVAGVAEAGDQFGAALASGDYNGDGRADLAIGALGENQFSGVVHVLYGSPTGLSAAGSQLWVQGNSGLGGVAEVNDSFGATLAAGDFGGDGWTDLAIAAFRENDEAGVVQVLYGSASGLRGAGSQLWSQNSPGVAGAAESGDQFGFALAGADLSGDFRGELTVGAPGENGNAGATHVLRGSAAGVTATGSQLWTQDNPGVAGVAEPDDRFGNLLTGGDFDGDGPGDLAIGAPIENTSGGVVHVLYGSAAGPTATGSQLWSQDSPGVADSLEGFDLFGGALADGDFDADGHADLAIGAWGENDFSGVAHVLYGSPAGLTATGSQLWSQGSPGVAGEPEVGDTFAIALAAGESTATPAPSWPSARPGRTSSRGWCTCWSGRPPG
jgi:FG-GAP repeat